MDLKQLVNHFAYKIEPKPEGGFIARATDPSVPPLEAPTREELKQKIQQNILTTLSAEFPGLKLPLQGKTVAMSFHVESTPTGGFSIHSSDPNAPVINTTDPKEFQSRFLEKFLGFAGNRPMPELSKALTAQAGSTEIKVVVNGKTAFQTKSDLDEMTIGTGNAFSPTGASSTSNANATKLIDGNASLAPLDGTIANQPITPEPSNAGKIFGFLLLVLIVAVVTYLFLHSR